MFSVSSFMQFGLSALDVRLIATPSALLMPGCQKIVAQPLNREDHKRRADFKNVRNLDKVHFGNACADDPPSFPDGFACELRRCNDKA
jgi:hypothetical protein